MSVKIRLAKVGKKNSSSYKVVVSNTKNKRNGKFLEILGSFNPLQTGSMFSIDKEKLNDWKKKGAQITDAVSSLLEGKYTYIKYNPKKAAAEATSLAEASKAEKQAQA